MYDAAGLRRSTGKIAACLNKICDDFYEHGQVPMDRLKELLGHTPFEVFVGALLGIYIAFVNHFYLFQ
jgi:acid phosphatase family membrane protein YuiD